MAMFRDSDGREWHPRMRALAFYRFESETGVDLFKEVLDGTLDENVFKSVSKLLKLLWVSVLGEAQERGVSFEQFAAGLSLKDMLDATEVIGAGIIESLPEATEDGGSAGANPGDGATSTGSPPLPK